MAPVLSNLYACLFTERWRERVSDIAGVGITLKYKCDKKLFRRYTRNSSTTKLTELQFADDVALPSTTRQGAEDAMVKYIEVAAEFGLTVSIPKTKLMVTGRQATADDRAPILVDGGAIESVPEFPHLGSVVSATGRVKPDVDQRVARASRAFGALRKPVFNNRDLKLETKRKIYQACVLSVLLYGSESWTPLRRDLRRLDSFHHRCVRNILGILNEQQWTQRLTHRCIRRRWGDNETATEIITKRRLEWLGHLTSMQSQRIPKITLLAPTASPSRRPPKEMDGCNPQRSQRNGNKGRRVV